jgi:predicted Zn-dependent protease with MMP-like domain
MKQATLEHWAAHEVSTTLAAFPPDVRRAAEQCSVSFEEAPGREPDDSDLCGDELGLFEGSSLMESENGDFDSLPRVRIFLRNIWEWVGEDEIEFREEVRITYLHEIGHFLGWDEDEVGARGVE